ncbi:Uncharacterised protein [Mycobacteroides abscessus subsp. abscessus]|nr:Uncharacterised protein [Mycobacteroides abscessus subsp. abscessus]
MSLVKGAVRSPRRGEVDRSGGVIGPPRWPAAPGEAAPTPAEAAQLCPPDRQPGRQPILPTGLVRTPRSPVGLESARQGR